jgi:sugar phosphate isomerase/epimerase
MSAVTAYEPFFYYSWEHVPDALLANIMAEFSYHGGKNLVFSHVWATRILSEPQFSSRLTRLLRQAGLNMGETHAPLGQAYDLCCPDRGRRESLLEDHRRAMAYSADAGCRTYTVHIGAYESVYYQTPNEVLRPYVLDSLEKLLPTAEKLGLVIALENSYERSNTPDEACFYVEQFNSHFLGCCFDVGHAHLMAPAPGKERQRYFSEIDLAWGDSLEEYPNALERMAPHIVTVHLHDNDGYSDAHALPGEGTIDFQALLPQLLRCPRLLSLQTEVRTVMGKTPLSVGRLVHCFQEIFARALAQ